MIIVSQDKTEILNFDNIFRLYVDTWSSEEFAIEPNCWCIKAEKSQDNLICVFLGEYKTEARAKEIIKEIWTSYSNFNYFKNATADGKNYVINLLKHKYEQFDIYEMPKE